MLRILKFLSLILSCLGFLFVFSNQAQAANIDFTANTTLNFTSVPSTLYVANGSAADALVVSGTTLDVDVPIGSSFTLKTAANTILSITPSVGTVSLGIDTTYFSTGYFTQWTASSSVGAATVAFSIKVALANTRYKITHTGGSGSYGYYQSDSSGFVSCTYATGFSAITFTIIQEDASVFVGGGGGGGGGDTTPTPTMPQTTSGTVTATASGGGKTTVTTIENAKASAELPANAVSADTTITITPIVKTATAVSTAIAVVPTGKSLVGANIYNFTAAAGTAAVSTFSQAITLTFTYTDSQITGLDESTLKVYYWDSAASQWKALTTTVNKDTNTLTAATGHFTYFAIMGEAAAVVVTPTPTAPTISGIPAEFKFEKTLKLGTSTLDIKYLQILLNFDSVTRVAESGVGSPGQETMYFGAKTKAAAIKFQEKYAADCLTPLGLTKGTGLIGAKTQAKLNSLLGAVSAAPTTPTPETPVVTAPVISGIPADFKFEKTLKLGMTSLDIKYLQIILNSDSATRVAESGVGSSGKETNYFGAKTQAAVIKFQEKYASEVLTPVGLTKGTGLVGVSTRAKLNALLGK